MKEAAARIVRTLQEAGHEALFAGGCVRDMLRGTDPKDFDIATSATPDEVLKLYPRGDSIGAHFGVILVRQDEFHFEIATFRKDGEYRDGRRPESVVFTSAQEDAKRRDFTVNGMFYDPVSEEIIDYVGGREDLEAGVIRAIGDPLQRFREDYLRLLRCIRFATRLNFTIAPETWEAVKEVSPRISEISPERIRDELDRIWLDRERVRGFDLLADSGLMQAILPEIMDLRGCEQPPQFHPEGDVYVHTRLMLSLLKEDASLPLVLSVLFHDIGKPATFTYDEEDQRIRFSGHDKLGADMARRILNRLKYPNAVIDAAVAGVEHHMHFMHVQDMRTAKLKRFMARDNFGDELELHRVDCAGSNGFMDNYEFLKEKQEEFANEPIIPPRFLTGYDLIERDWPRGRTMGAVLDAALDLQMEGQLSSREEALAWLDQQEPTDYAESQDA